jgi:uncharacterized protein (TIGR03435 family)
MHTSPSRRRAIVAFLALLAATVAAGLLWITRDRAGDLSPWPAFEIGKELSAVSGVSLKVTFDLQGTSKFSGYFGNEVRLDALSATFRDVLEHAYPIPRGGIAWQVEPPPVVFDLSAGISSGGKDELSRRLREAFAQIFRIRGTYEPRECSVLLLKRSEKHALRIAREPDSLSEDATDGSHLHRGPSSKLADWLQERLRVPVLDETGVAEDILVSLSWKNDPEKELLESLEQNGLSLEKATRTVETLVISR